MGADIYYYLKADAKNVKLTIKDLEGTVLADITASGSKGLQKIFWGLNRIAAGGAGAGGRGGFGGGGGRGGGGRGGRGNQVDNGVYNVTLTVDGKDIATKKMTISPDPMFK